MSAPHCNYITRLGFRCHCIEFFNPLNDCRYEQIEAHVPDADKKLLVNIKKRRERAKRKKAANAEMESGDEEAETEAPITQRGKSYNNAYEDALYGSESELDDSEEEEEREIGMGKEKRQKKEKVGGMVKGYSVEKELLHYTHGLPTFELFD